MKKTFGYILLASILASSSANASWFSWGSDDKDEHKNRRTPVLNKAAPVVPVMPQAEPLYPQQQMQTGILQPTASDFMRPSYQPQPDYAQVPQMPATQQQSYMGQGQNFYQPPAPRFKSLDYAPPPPEAFIQIPPALPPAPQYTNNGVDNGGYPLLGATPPSRPAPKSLDQDERVNELKNEFSKSENLREPLLQQMQQPIDSVQIPPAPQNNYVPPSQSYAALPPAYQFGGSPITVRSNGVANTMPESIPQYSTPKPEYASAPNYSIGNQASGGVFPQNSKSITVKSLRSGGGYVVNAQPVQENVIPGGSGFVFDESTAQMQGNAGTLQEYQTANVSGSQIPQYVAPTQYTASAAPRAEVYRQPVLPPDGQSRQVRRLPQHTSEEIILPRQIYTPPSMPEIKKSIDVSESYQPVPSSFDSPLYSRVQQTHSYQDQRQNNGHALLRPSRYEQQRKSSKRFD